MVSRFDCPSASLSLRTLLKHMRGALWTGLGLAIVVHLGLAQVRGSAQAQKPPKPLTTQFIKRQPRLTKPLEMKKRPRPKRRQMQRRMVAIKARVDRQQVSSSVRTVEVVRRLAKPKVQVDRFTQVGVTAFEPQAVAEAIAGSKEAKQILDMSLELLDIDALDTGQYHAMVVQDPADKKNIQGFCHLAVLFIPRLHGIVVQKDPTRQSWFDDYVVSSVRRLVDAINRYTQIRADIKTQLTMDSAELFKTPWIFFSIIFNRYEFSEYEMEVMGEYMMAGGFIFADAHPPWGHYADVRSHELNIVGSLRTQGIMASPERLPNTHPVYHCYFDFSGPPAAADGSMVRDPGGVDIVDHLNGVIVEGRLLAILTEKGYYAPWSYWATSKTREYYQKMDPTRALQFGVNTIIFALVQEGSITHRVMDMVGH